MNSNVSQTAPPNQPSAEELMSQLNEIYKTKGKESEFSTESRVFADLIPKLIQDLQTASHILVKPFALGSTATVWLVKAPLLNQDRALKLPRPRLGKLRDIISIIRTERARLAMLNHQNVIKIYFANEVNLAIDGEEYSFPYFIMDYLEGVKDLDDYILGNRPSLSAEDVIGCFRDVLHGISYLHQESIIHCDLKPGNILIGPNTPALIADLGYSKPLTRSYRHDSNFTHVVYTPPYAHPELKKRMIESSDSNANVARIPRSDLRVAFDLFAAGRTIQEILSKLRAAEASDLELQKGSQRASIFSRYQWLYLSFITKRLLDGQVERHGTDDFTGDVIPGLPESIMREISYQSADEVLEDFEKLLHLYDLEGEVPELNPDISTYLQVPLGKVPLTQRVEEIINHPNFRRLAQVTQLGFVSLVYPGGTHTRFEHVLGTFAQCCNYIRALWYDQTNCLFQSIMARRDLELGLLAALLHDIGQYPMAHDLTEVTSSFSHEGFTIQALQRVHQDCDATLAQVIKSEWGIDVEEVGSVIKATENSPFRHRLLNSIISGPLDCDKLDYLRRDSIHLGVPFGLAIDEERLLRNLTIVYNSAQQTLIQPDGLAAIVNRLAIAEIGVTEKALAVAKSVWKIRQDMFSQVYWQHTVRALKAMLGYVVRNILIRLQTEQQQEEFWKEFQEWAFNGRPAIAFVEFADASKSGSNPTPMGETQVDFSEESNNSFDASSGLSPSDDTLLWFLWGFASDSEKRIIQAIRTRSLFRRLAVLSGARTRSRYDNIYNQFWSYRINGKLKDIEDNRKKWETAIVNEVEQKLPTDERLVPFGITAGDLIETLRTIEPLVLVDIPVKATSKSWKQEAFWYLPEDISGIHSRDIGPFPRFQQVDINLEQQTFDKEIGKIRVFVDPQWSRLLARCLQEEKVLQIISS